MHIFCFHMYFLCYFLISSFFYFRYNILFFVIYTYFLFMILFYCNRDLEQNTRMNIWVVVFLALTQCVVGQYVQTQPKLVGTGASGAAQQGRSTAVSGDGMTACVGGWADKSDIGAVWIYALANSIIYHWNQ